MLIELIVFKSLCQVMEITQENKSKKWVFMRITQEDIINGFHKKKIFTDGDLEYQGNKQGDVMESI